MRVVRIHQGNVPGGTTQHVRIDPTYVDILNIVVEDARTGRVMGHLMVDLDRNAGHSCPCGYGPDDCALGPPDCRRR